MTMNHPANVYSVHASVGYKTEDGYTGNHHASIPSFFVLGATEDDARANAARVYPLVPGMIYTVPGSKHTYTVTSATFTVYPNGQLVEVDPDRQALAVNVSWLYRSVQDFTEAVQERKAAATRQDKEANDRWADTAAKAWLRMQLALGVKTN